MDLFQRYHHLIRPGGTNLSQRMLPALEKDYIRPDERTLPQLFAYARAVAAELRFRGLSGQAAGDWSAMFDPVTDRSGAVLEDRSLLAARDASDAWPPQLALLFSFFEVFGHVQDDFNTLPARHLAHYFEDVLKLERRPAKPDRVHVIFELARNSEPVRLQAEALLDAGKDAQGRPLTYALERETIVSHARISDVRRLVAQRDRQGRLRFFKADALPAEGSWPTFGAEPFELGPATDEMEEVDLGFAVSDPILRLAEGTRQIDVTVRLEALGDAPAPLLLTTSVRIELTGEEGWFAPGSVSAALTAGIGGLELRIAMEIPEGAPAIVDFDPALHQETGAPAGPWPVLRCLVRSQSGRYETLAGLSATEVDIFVAVDGIRDLVLQNDQGTLVPGKPIPSFGQRPTIGSNFYIGSHEVFSKELTGLTLRLSWQDLPDDLFAHYRQYFDMVDSVLASMFRPSFTAVVDLLDRRSWAQRLTGEFGSVRLFDDSLDTRTISFAGTGIAAAHAKAPYGPDPHMAEVESYRVDTARGFLRLQLKGPTNDDLSTFGVPYARDVPFKAFGHDAFAPRYSARAIELARHDPDSGPEPVLPNEPYTPTLSEVSLGYSARSRFKAGDLRALGRFYTVDAFGYTTAGPAEPACLVPPFEARAALFLGLEQFSAPGTASVLFQIDEGSALVAESPEPSDIVWSCLSGDRWIDLPRTAVLVDETRRFQTPGIVSVTVAAPASIQHTAMPGGLTWLRARLSEPPRTVARTLRLHTQAATAIFRPEGEPLSAFGDHLARGLQPGAIGKLKRRRAAIKGVSQPYPSFGGREEEAGPRFFERTTERLRHRDRAVTVWDFERHVLEHFDGVFKVRCLAHSDAQAQPKVGEAALVIVPSMLSSQSSHRLEPRAGETLMGEIRAFVADRIGTPFASVHVIHPLYERILVDARVAFRAGFDPGFYAEQLNTDLQRFLSPWAFEEGRDIVFGNRIYRSELLKFVEDRPYVDYVTRFDLYHAFDGPPRDGIGFMEIGLDFVIAADPQPAIEAMTVGTDFVVGRPVDTAATTRPNAVMVSHRAHRIEPIIPGLEQCTGVSQLGIGYMAVGLDFEVAA